MFLKKTELIIAFIILSLSLFAKEKFVTLQSNVNGKNYILKIDKMDIKVNIVGNIAETTMDITFRNDLNKQIEGMLYVPMKENASVFEYQFEMNKVMKTGVVVEKQKARVAYEETVRKKVDPGLLIWTKGNNFKTRIYPINAKSTKRIIVSYQEELTVNFNKDCGGLCPSYYYTMPLNIKYKISRFSLKITSNGTKVIPVSKRKNRFISDKAGNITLIDENYIPDENIKIGIFNKKPFKYEPIVNFSYNKKKKNWYFTATVFPSKNLKNKRKPEKLCIFWDTSLSMSERNIQKELDFTEKYLKTLKNPKVKLITFSNDIQKIKTIKNNKNQFKNLKTALINTIYDGGTSLGAINTQKYQKECEEVLVFTDGISNFGNNKPILTIPSYFINSKLTAEHSYMKYLSELSGGKYINLQNTTVNKALYEINHQSMRIISINKNSKPCLSCSAGELKESLTITGIVKKKNTKIKLHIGKGIPTPQSRSISASYPSQEGIKITIAISPESKQRVPATERLYARIKLNELFKQKEKNKKEIINISQKYSILTEFTSFLVLETIDDYLKYKIIPPENMQKEYFQIIEKQKLAEENNKKEQIEKVLEKYNEFKNWWATKHQTITQVLKEKRNHNKKMIRALHMLRSSSGSSGYGALSENKEEADKSLSDAVNKNEIMVKGEEKSIGSSCKGMAKKSGSSKTLSASIELKTFDPDTPYLKELKKAKKHHYELYLKLRKNYKKSSSFYLDVSDFFMKRKNKKLALKILSNIAELELENHELLRILGYRLWQLKQYKLAEYTFSEVLKMRGEEPQSYRDLGLTYREMKKYNKAVEYLYKVATTAWDSRFSDIDLIALYEMNAIIARHKKHIKKIKQFNIDKRLIKNLPVDIRVVLSWDTNDTDIDLWVTDPTGEKCFYENKRTAIGGYNTNDFTGGYGPEMFTLRNAGKGVYKIQANYYGSSNQSLSGEVTLHVELFLNYGKKNQTRKEIVVRVKNEEQVIDLGEFKVK